MFKRHGIQYLSMPFSEDPRGFIRVHLSRLQPPPPKELAALTRDASREAPARLLVVVDDGFPPGLSWRLEWLAYVTSNAHRLRVAFVRPPLSGVGLGSWARRAGAEFNEFDREEHAVAWLLA